MRVFQYHSETVRGVAELIGAMGVEHTNQISAAHFIRRTDTAETKSFSELYEFIPKGSLLSSPYPKSFEQDMKESDPETFAPLLKAA